MATAAAVAATTTTAAADGGVQLDSIPIVDLRFLSQSELYALSMLSPSSFNPRLLNDVVVPKIDRSIFNESAGSRKQTYSRLRLAPASLSPFSSTTTTIHRRTPHLRATNPSPELSIHSDPENAQIVTLLKHLFVEEETNNAELVPVRIDYADSLPQLTANAGPTGSKRKRGRPKRNETAVPLMQDEPGNEFFDGLNDNVVMNEIVIYENVEDRDKEVVNRDGVAVDLVALGAMGNPYGEELWRRTEGLGSEEQLLVFLQGLNGQWGSRRKKKRIVDASEFGNALPRGWKLLLSIKKKEGRAWVYCRRYISPNGRQFGSCKEVSSYLLSLHGLQDPNQPNSVQSAESSKVIGTWASAGGEAELFRGNGKYNYNTGYQELGLGRNEPVEYSFMTTQSSSSLPGQSRAFSYDADMGQGFDNSFWLGKDASMPNFTGTNQVPTICVWCRNEFYQDPVQSGTVGSSIGSMCPTCSGRIQFNVS